MEHDALNGHAPAADCVFCQEGALSHILKETPAFLLVADYAPLVEGHLLIIPKQHYACYGAVPAALDAELAALKDEVRQFMARYYAPCVFWEHGVFRQTVFHAHLHCIPFGVASYEISATHVGSPVRSQEDIRAWYRTRGNYFYMEDSQKALLFAPDLELYQQIVRDVLWRGMQAHSGVHVWRSKEQRYAEGAPLLAALAQKWQQFQQEEVSGHAHETGSR